MGSPPQQPPFAITTNDGYRSDVDGLRAIAVLSVILGHLNNALLPGGFVGVDIFFVISGFLISQNILRDLDRQRFSLLEFYRRRIKRIAPPMLVVVAVTFVLAQTILRPEDAEQAAESALWSVFSLANVYFWARQDTGYFAPASNQLPLLHLWSLGVEEQFYLIWPVLLAFFYRRARTAVLFATITALSVASFIAGELLFARDPTFAFYMLPTRAGGLMAGALVALAVVKKPNQTIPAWVVAPSAAAGLGLIGASLFLFSEEMVFPGLRAAAPTIGTALVILAGHCGDHWPSQALKWRPLTWIGLVSYSAYLWHWPLLAFFRYGRPSVGIYSGAAIFTLTWLCAWLSYRYIESPARRSELAALTIFWRYLVIPSGALALLTLGAIKLDGYGVRWLTEYKPGLAAIRLDDRPPHNHDYVCQRRRLRPVDAIDQQCVVGPAGEALETLLWGDSHASYYVGMVGVFANRHRFRFRNFEVESCPPILSDPTPYVSAKRLQDCRASIEVMREVVKAHNVIILAATWLTYQGRSQTFMDAVTDTLRQLSADGKKVILIGRIPSMPDYDPLCREKALSYPFLECPRPTAQAAEIPGSANLKLRELVASTPNLTYFDATPYLCPGGICAAIAPNGSRIYYDSTHLTNKASWDLGEKIVAGDGVPFPFSLIGNHAQTNRRTQ